MQINFDIIIPYFNEEKTAIQTLKKLNSLIIKPKKILFIDSKSTDKSCGNIFLISILQYTLK